MERRDITESDRLRPVDRPEDTGGRGDAGDSHATGESSSDESPKRRAILDAAQALFVAKGYGAVSMDAIARRARVSKQTVYSHFGDKAGLFAATMDAQLRDLLQPLAGLKLRERSPRDALGALADRYLDLLVSAEALNRFRVVIVESRRFPELAEAFYRAGPRVTAETLTRYLATLHADGRLHIDDPAVAAQQFYGMLRGDLHIRALLGLPMHIDAAARQALISVTIDTFLRAYAPRD